MQPLFGIRDTSAATGPSLPAALNEDAFWPYEPKTLEECGLSEMAIESLILQTFLSIGTLTGRGMTDRVGVPYRIVEQQLAQLRVRQLIVHARPAPLNDFYYSLTENGQKRAQSYQKLSSYTGPAPVPLMDYILSVEAQASNFDPITLKELKAALDGVTYEPSWLDFLGPAINSNSGIFLYGPPGNGKTTLARCLANCRGQEIWIPHAIIEDGMIIKLFDASYHIPSNTPIGNGGIIADQEHDRRWLRIRRPTVVVGGELTLDNLEIRHDPRSNTCEAPLQMKSNCGCLLIDDFGRQRVAPAELLNRWIVPLESRHDFLNLPTGKKFCVPFEQTILFSTNLQPEDLVDEAFLRRVPFKINIGDPSIQEFMDLFKRACEGTDVPWRPDLIEKLIVKHYHNVGRPLRRCHPRDLLKQVVCLCAYRGERVELRTEFLDLACTNYFGNQPIMQSSESMLAKPVGWDVPNQKGANATGNGGVGFNRPTPTSLGVNSQPLRTEVIRNPAAPNAGSQNAALVRPANPGTVSAMPLQTRSAVADRVATETSTSERRVGPAPVASAGPTAPRPTALRPTAPRPTALRPVNAPSVPCLPAANPQINEPV